MVAGDGKHLCAGICKGHRYFSAQSATGTGYDCGLALQVKCELRHPVLPGSRRD